MPGRGPAAGRLMEIQELLERSLALGEQGRWEEMAATLRAALEEEPDDPYLLGWLGVAEQELGNDGMAYEYFRECIAQEPLDPHLLALAGAGLAGFDDPDAEPTLRAAALSGPGVPAARLHYGAYLARAGMFEEALEHLRAAVELAPEDPAAHGELGAALAMKGEPGPAAEAMETALDLAPEDEWTRVLLGLLHLEAGRLEEAATELVRASEGVDDDAECHILAALAAAAVGWEDAAYAALGRAEQVAEAADHAAVAEAEERITSGAEPARALLADALGPSALRERLAEPL